jgi:hypothetical protein
METLLFSKIDWYSFVRQQKAKLSQEILNLKEQQVLNASFDDLCSYFVQKYSLIVPVLNESEKYADQRDIKMNVSQDPNRLILDRSTPFYVSGTVIEIMVPFIGDLLAFNIRPSSYSTSPPRAVVSDNTLTMSFMGTNLDANEINSKLARLIGEISVHLDRLRIDAERLRTELVRDTHAQIKQRKDKFLSDRNLVSSLGIPLRRRENAPQTYRAQEVRRRVQTQPPATTSDSFVPEPALELVEYDHILKVISEMALVMERSPSACEAIKEEDLRTHFLVQLNGHYEGQATGETFNFSGKTDILIRSAGRNIFVAECKYWGGASKLIETIDQLLGYLSWRDTKAAILVFNKQKNFSRVIDEIRKNIINHKNYKRQIAQLSDTSFRYVFHQIDDVNREMIVTVMAFNIPHKVEDPKA